MVYFLDSYIHGCYTLRSIAKTKGNAAGCEPVPPKNLGGSMKKLSIVLLALLFVSGYAAAVDIDVGGEAKASYTFDLDAETLKYDVSDADLDVDFNISLATGDAESRGAGAAYALLEASASLYIDTDFFFQDGSDDKVVAVDDDGEEADYYPVLATYGIDVFEIHTDLLKIDFLGYPDEYTRAESFMLDANYVTPGFAKDGIAVTLKDLGLLVGVTLEYDGGVDYGFYSGWKGEVEGLSYDIVGGLRGEAGDFKGLDFALALGYALDVASIDVAMDMADVGGDDFAMDARFSSVFDLGMVSPTLDAYFVFADAAETGLEDDFELWVRGGVEDVDLGMMAMDFTLTAEEIMNNLYLDVDSALKLYDLPLEIGAFGGYGLSGPREGDIAVGGNVTYTYDVFKLFGEVSYADTAAAGDSLGMEFSVSSEALIDNACVSLGWASDDVPNELGAITAAVTVGF